MEKCVEDITILLNAIRTGDEHAGRDLLPKVYGELRRMAAAKMAKESHGQTIQATMLVHDAWMQLCEKGGAVFENRSHFFAAAAEAMRRILVGNARRRLAQKRAGSVEHVDISELEIVAPTGTDDEILAVNESLERFAAADPRKAELVKLRYFTGISLDEVASLLDISISTANRYWLYARAWLHADISEARGKEF